MLYYLKYDWSCETSYELICQMKYVVFCLLAHRLSMMVLCNLFQLETIFETRKPQIMLSQ